MAKCAIWVIMQLMTSNETCEIAQGKAECSQSQSQVVLSPIKLIAHFGMVLIANCIMNEYNDYSCSIVQ